MGKYTKAELLDAFEDYKRRRDIASQTGDWNVWADCFTEDVVLTVVGGVYKFELAGRDNYLAMVRDGAHAEMVTQHNGHHPEIDLVDDRTARGLWYLSDYVQEFRRRQHIQGTAFYRDTYVKEGGLRLEGSSALPFQRHSR